MNSLDWLIILVLAKSAAVLAALAFALADAYGEAAAILLLATFCAIPALAAVVTSPIL